MNEVSQKILERIETGRQYRRNEAAIFRAKEPVDGEGSCPVTGYACTFNDPYELYRYYDVYEDMTVIISEQIDPAAFDECDMSDVIMQFDHQGRVFARTRNKTVDLSPDEHGLKVDAELGKSAGGPGLYKDVQSGTIDRMSIAFTVAEDRREETEDRENKEIRILRTITKIGKLYDVSAVSFPANDGTELSARSYSDGVIAELTAERLAAREDKKKRALLELELILGKAKNED